MIDLYNVDYNDRSICNEYGAIYGMRNNEKINSFGADINMIVGERSNGKTYPTIVFEGVKAFIDSDYKKSFAYVRRYEDDLKDTAPDLFKGMIENGWLEWYSKGKWNGVKYYRKKWYLIHTNKDGKEDQKSQEPMAYAYSINRCEGRKGPDIPTIKTIVLDEFIPMKDHGYIPAEFRLWKNVVSTIVRRRGDVKIYMLANTLSQECPYFENYHIDASRLEQGTIYIYNLKSGGKLAVEYAPSVGDAFCEHSKFFELDDVSDASILSGSWETGQYPPIPKKFRKYKERSELSFFIVRNDKIIQGDIFRTDAQMMIYFHQKTTPIRNIKKDVVYLEHPDPDLMDLPNWRVGFRKFYQLDKIILKMISNNQCYYQDGFVGDRVKYYLSNT